MPILRNFLIVPAAVRASIAATVLLAIVLGARPAMAATISLDERYPDAQSIFHCKFDARADADRDGWPDRWTRERSATHPPYLEVRVDPSSGPPEAGHSLRVKLDGGAAAAYTPAIPVRAIFSYVFECQVKTDGLLHDRAYMSVTIYDAQNKVLERLVSSGVGASVPWTRLRIGPIAPSNEAAHHAVIGLHVEPGERADLRGSAAFADVWAAHLPQLKLQANRRNHLYVDPQRPEVTCIASGFVDQDAMVDFELLDVEGNELARERLHLQRNERLESGGGARAADVLVGTATWKPPLPGVGFYRVRVSMSGRRDSQHQREISLAVIQEQKGPSRGEFGWTLPQGEKPLALSELAELVQHAGINWLKFPVWDAGGDARRNEQLVRFSERLQVEGVELIGLLVDPPAAVRKHLNDADRPAAAQIFTTEPEIWYPSLEPIATRLSLAVRWWQLGRDDDQSFVNYPQLASTIGRVRKQMGRYGQEVRLGFGWSWLQELPADKPADFVSLSSDPPLTGPEQAAYLQATSKANTRRWVVLRPLPAQEYTALDRARDLAERMLAAKIQRADGIFVPEVYSTRQGLLNDDGSVGELYLPWRTTALAISGADYLGSLRLPGGSTNHVFARDRQLAMVLWNDRPGEEQVSLGDNVREVDLWGKRTQPPVDQQGQQRIPVERLPVILTGLSEPLIRFQMSAALEQTQWPSVFGVAHANALVLTNPFPQGASGTVRLMTPEQWRVVPRDLPFKLSAGETRAFPFEVTLPFDAGTGRQEVRLEFDVNADRRYQFQVYRTVEIGLNDVYIEVTTRLNEKGELVVEQKLVNETDDLVNFKCFLFAPDRRRMVSQVLEQGRGVDLKTYRLPQGADLLGKTLWLRAEEITGRRILNYRFPGQP